jgi:hypothetical protein
MVASKDFYPGKVALAAGDLQTEQFVEQFYVPDQRKDTSGAQAGAPVLIQLCASFCASFALA